MTERLGDRQSNIPLAFRVRKLMELAIRLLLFICAFFAIFVAVAIAILMVVETLRFMQFISLGDFLFGLRWNPGAITAEFPMGAFGIVPLFVGTLTVTVIAMIVAIPAGIFSAVYLSQYSSARFRSIVKPALEVLAGIPTVVYGFFAMIAVSPLLQTSGQSVGVSVSSESALGIGLVMAIMIMPYIASLTDDVLFAVSTTVRDGALALGATMSESIKNVIFPAAVPGIMAAILLAVSRAIGETMIVVMAAGYSSKLTANPLEAVTTVTVQIVSLLTGDQEFDSPKTLAAFALGLVLFLVTLSLNIVAMRIVRKYRKQCE